MSDVIAVYADGGVVKVNPSPHGGTWAYCHVNAAGERVATGAGFVTPAQVGLPTVTNNVTELLALLAALERLPDGWSGNVYSDSLNAIRRMESPKTAKFKNCPDQFRERAIEVRARLGKLTFTLLGGHPNRKELAEGRRSDGMPVSQHNVWCDKACGEQAKGRVAEPA
ncbi:MAG: hypothetical protein C0467_06090 [Planctomycetaceae bacterium]|nr:hypothetical protein [Planctomycetaceae bacterium]